MKIRLDLSVNSFIESLILSDFLIFFSLGLLAPIFAIFISEQIAVGDGLRVIGLATSIYWIVRCLVAPPLSRFMDKTDGERDEFAFMFFGYLLAAILPLFYIVASEPWHIYLLQGLLAIAFSMAIPGWRILFTNHLDNGKTGYEWSLEDVSIGLSTALSAYVGAVIAERFGFATLFVSVSVVGFMGTLLILPMRHHIKARKEVLKIRKKRHLCGTVASPK
ncbi:MAG: MFS transporter [Patescibacteria group bacterium]